VPFDPPRIRGIQQCKFYEQHSIFPPGCAYHNPDTFDQAKVDAVNPFQPWECSKCDWNAIRAGGLEHGQCKVINGQNTNTDWGPGQEMHIECKCPKCGHVFEYFDGYP